MTALLALTLFGLLLARLLRAPRGTWRFILGAAVLLALAGQLLPPGTPYRIEPQVLRAWGWLGLAALPFAAYGLLIRHLRRRTGANRIGPSGTARPAEPETAPVEAPAPTPGTALGAEELERYTRHILLREIGGPGQARLRAARVLVIGAGGLGSPTLLYLAAAGVGRIRLADDDRVSLSNLQRQILFATGEVGVPKVEAATAALERLNPHVAVEARNLRFTPETAAALLEGVDLVLDGSDSFATRAAVNAACVAARVPLLAAAIGPWEGQISLWDPARGGPCLACVFPEAPAPGLAPDCAIGGVVGALPGVMGALLALEAIKHLTGAGSGLRGVLFTFDGLHADARRFRASARPDCPVCAGLGGAPTQEPPATAAG